MTIRYPALAWLAAAGVAAGLAFGALPWDVWSLFVAVGIMALILASAEIAVVAAALAVPFGNLAAVQLSGAQVTPAAGILTLGVLGVGLRWAWQGVSTRTLATDQPGRQRTSETLESPRLDAPRGLADGGGIGRSRTSLVFVAAGCAFLLIQAASAWRSPDWTAAGLEVARWLLFGMAFGLAVAARRQAVLAGLLAAGSIAAGVGLWMAAQGVGPDAFVVLGGDLKRAYGTFGQPNPFGGYMNMVWPLGAGVLLASVAGRRPLALSAHSRAAGPWLTPLAAVGAFLATAGLLLSFSRGAWLGAAAAGTAIGLLWLAAVLPKIMTPVRLAGASLVAAAILAAWPLAPDQLLPGAVAGRVSSIGSTFAVWNVSDAEVTDANYATIERVAHWQAAAAMWAERPWLGQGPGHYEVLYPHFRLPRWEPPLGHAHNWYLHVLAESGLLGLATFLGAGAAAAALAVRRSLGSKAERALGLGTAGVLAAVAVHSLVDNLFVHDMTVHLGLLLGATAASTNRASTNSNPAEKRT